MAASADSFGPRCGADPAVATGSRAGRARARGESSRWLRGARSGGGSGCAGTVADAGDVVGGTSVPTLCVQVAASGSNSVGTEVPPTTGPHSSIAIVATAAAANVAATAIVAVIAATAVITATATNHTSHIPHPTSHIPHPTSHTGPAIPALPRPLSAKPPH
ncbi:DUF6053 domain-containing protein [Lysobacter enzymogenes]|uniref:DUF6053 domain-containing protein n=1 Tax=Lysobacter enzymogenes TaxID=69 RepID=UPI003749AC57